MIPRTGRTPNGGVKERYEPWENRRVARFKHWSVRRRWVTFVLAPLMLLCCGGGVLAVPVVWFWRVTVAAGKGASTSDAAADDYLAALSYDNTDGLLPILNNDDTLLAQWRVYRKAMDGTHPPPSRLDYGPLTVGPAVGGRSEVSVDVSATWWGSDSTDMTGYRSNEQTWRFQMRDEDGWRVTAVQAPTWCGGYVRLNACT